MRLRRYVAHSYVAVCFLSFAVVGVFSVPVAAQVALGTSFAYQGRLEVLGSPATGSFDFEFRLYDDPDPFAATLIGTDTHAGVVVDDGLFTVELDFGDVFDGEASWLEIRVRRSSGGVLTSLFPLQPLTAAPNAHFTRRAGTAATAGHATSSAQAANADRLDGLDSLAFVTSEVDPTVPASVKDGVSWSELSGIPAGFADGVDNVGTGGVPVGTIVAFAGATLPSGWLLCDGSAVSRTTFAALFAVLGGTWGIGDGLTTFNLPDLQGRVPLGSGAGAGLSPRTITDQGGEETHLLTVAEMPSHRHTFGFSTGDQNGGIGVRFLNSGSGVSTSAEGGDQPHNNMQPFTVVHYIVKH